MKDSLSARNRNKEQYKTYYYQIIVFVFLTGIRGGEMQALTDKDIDFKKHQVKIRNTATYKTKVIPKLDGTEYKEGEKKLTKRTIVIKEPKSKAGIRTIGISAQVEKDLKRIIELRPDKSCPLLLCTSNGAVVDKRRFERKFDEILKWSEIKKKGRSIHALRHTFISYAIEKNKMSPLADKTDPFISRYVGHKTLEITYKVYTHISEGKVKSVDFNKEIKISDWE